VWLNSTIVFDLVSNLWLNVDIRGVAVQSVSRLWPHAELTPQVWGHRSLIIANGGKGA
jgi:hypothetical protein